MKTTSSRLDWVDDSSRLGNVVSTQGADTFTKFSRSDNPEQGLDAIRKETILGDDYVEALSGKKQEIQPEQLCRRSGGQTHVGLAA
jgi:hypothetical protein